MLRITIKREWTLGGHVDVGSFSRLFDLATDAFRDGLGIGSAYARERDCSFFVLESHLTYRSEVREGEQVTIASLLLGCDTKRLRLFQTMRNAGDTVCATCEQMLVHVDRTEGRSRPLDESLQRRLLGRLEADRQIGVPQEAGRGIRTI